MKKKLLIFIIIGIVSLSVDNAFSDSARIRMEEKIKKFSQLMDELGEQGIDLTEFQEMAEKSHSLSEQRQDEEAEKIMDGAIRRMEELKFENAIGIKEEDWSLLKQDWEWSNQISIEEQTEPLAMEFCLIVSEAEYTHIPLFIQGAQKRGIKIKRTKSDDYASLQKARIVVIVGNPSSGEGVGELLRKILDEKELRSILEDEPKMRLWTNVFGPRQIVIIFSAPMPSQMGELAIGNSMDVYMRIEPPLTKRGQPRFNHLYSAISDDGLSWKEEGEVLIRAISVPDIVKLDKGYRLYFVDGIIDTTNCAYSEDGKSWRFERFKINSSIRAVDPNVIRLEDGRYRLYFDEGFRDLLNRRNSGLLSAISKDGINFEIEEGIRYNEPRMADPEVLKMGEIYRLYYPSDEPGKIKTAISYDGGFTFKKESTLPLQNAGASFEIITVEGGWRMYYNSREGFSVAFSFDGLNWKFEKALGFEVANPAVVKLPDGKWRMYYNR